MIKNKHVPSFTISFHLMRCIDKLSIEKIASVGDLIEFTRNGNKIVGQVVKVREASIVVSIRDEDAELIKIETPITVVSHNNYKLIN